MVTRSRACPFRRSIISTCAGMIGSPSNSVTADSLSAVLPSFLACCARLRSLCTETASLKRKLDDTRIVTRAKLLLMSRLKMSEAEAHRYIEKTAMDTGSKRREVAESIIRTYEE